MGYILKNKGLGNEDRQLLVRFGLSFLVELVFGSGLFSGRFWFGGFCDLKFGSLNIVKLFVACVV